MIEAIAQREQQEESSKRREAAGVSSGNAGAKEPDRVYGTALRTVVCTTRGNEASANSRPGYTTEMVASPWGNKTLISTTLFRKLRRAMAGV